MVQGVFLLFFFLSKEHRQREVNRFHALLLFCMVCAVLEIFLGYTGYMLQVLFLVDFSEVHGLLIGPSFYLLIVSLARGPVAKKYYWHFAFPALYLLAQLPFLLLPEDAKYNAYVGAFRPDLPYRPVEVSFDDGRFFLTQHHTELTLASLFLYGILGLMEVIKAFRERKESLWAPQHPVLRTMRLGTFQVTSAFVIILVVKLLNERDYGDHLLAAYIALTIYFTSFTVIAQSGFFRQAPLSELQKYKNSSITGQQQADLLDRLKLHMETQKPYLHGSFSLPELAQQLNISVHVLSQAINEGLGKNFFELTAEYRVEEAKRLLKEQAHVKVEEIAEQVGYHSKSSFNTAFKKITGLTPSEFRQT